MIKYLKRLFCKHEFYQDIQITLLRCNKCGEEHRLLGYKDLYPSVLSFIKNSKYGKL